MSKKTIENIPGKISFEEAISELHRYTGLVSDMEFTPDEMGLNIPFLQIRLNGIRALTELVEEYSNKMLEKYNQEKENNQ